MIRWGTKQDNAGHGHWRIDIELELKLICNICVVMSLISRIQNITFIFTSFFGLYFILAPSYSSWSSMLDGDPGQFHVFFVSL